jgi:hypothetical protein
MRSEAAEELGLKADTLRKAINQGRVSAPASATVAQTQRPQEAAAFPRPTPSDKSSRSEADAAAGEEMGVACTRPCERVLAALGKLPGGARTKFQSCRDVSYGGVLCALPALAGNGLFRHLSELPPLSGYYSQLHVILLLAYMGLCRIKAVEQLQYAPPGELGKLMGLDRIPEVRCLRYKLSQLAEDDAPARWAATLSQQWMAQAPEHADALYVDGHVRLYHGNLTPLPARYVARQRLCLRGTTDYWVNDALGQPFFSIERPVDHGLLEALRNDIVPRLLQDVPEQPTDEQLAADPRRSRFTLIFDREGYSPPFFREMRQQHRISCITYHKFPKDDWPEAKFEETQVAMPRGEVVSMKLAEGTSWIGDRKEGLQVREVRKLTASGHQVSLISTALDRLADETVALLFSRWSQENFFAYAMEHFGLDALSEYGTEPIPDTNKPLINPAWRTLDAQLRSAKAKIGQRRSRYGALTLDQEKAAVDEGDGPRHIQQWVQDKADLREAIEQLENEQTTLQQQRASTPKHLAWKDLPDEAKFERLRPNRKRLIDTVMLVGYRAETAMTAIVREDLAHWDEARALLRDLFRSDADILPDQRARRLEVRVHTMANPRSNRAVQHLLKQLNAAEFTYPGTDLRLTYTLAASPSG